ncbi:MAG: methyltransferase, partial [bacterium]
GLPQAVRSGASIYEHQLGVSIFDYFRTHPEDGAIFDQSMTNFSSQIAPAIAGSPVFAPLRQLIDVGGGQGYLLATILRQYPHLTGTVVDLADVTIAAPEYPDLAGRLSFNPGSFFESLPTGADGYVMKHILHDWSDIDSGRILQQIHGAMAPNGTLFVVEHVIQHGNGPDFAKLLDLEMLTVGGKERTAAEFRKLFADNGFTLTEFVPTHSALAIIIGKRTVDVPDAVAAADPPPAPPPPDLPIIPLMQLITAEFAHQAIYTMAVLGIADELGDEPLLVDTLATRSNCHPDALFRLLRAGACLGVFSEVSPRMFAHTPMSRLLRINDPLSLRDAVIFFNAPYQRRGLEGLAISIKTGEPAWNAIFHEVTFATYEKNPEMQRDFMGAMTAMSRLEMGPIVAAFDPGDATEIIDIAGGHGQLLSAILSKHVGLRGMVYDLDFVTPHAAERFAVMGLIERTRVESGDFFDHVPHGGQCYLMKYILHDWADEDAVRILRNIATVMDPNGKLVVIDAVIPPGDQFHLGKLIDIQMAVIGGRERTEEQFRALFAVAGLRLDRIIPTGMHLSLIEARKV